MPDKNDTPKDPAEAGTAVVERNATDASTYKVFDESIDMDRVLKVYEQNLQGEAIGERDLPKVTIPAQGMTIFNVPGPDGDEHHETITGILVKFTKPQAYWEKELDLNNVVPPNCSSPDGIIGYGDPGGECLKCAFNQFGSDKREGSNAKACKEKRMLFILRPDSILPTVIQGATASIGPVKDYLMEISNDGFFHHEVYTEVSLEKVGAGPTAYGRLKLRNVGRVQQDIIPKLEAYKNGVEKILEVTPQEVLPDADNAVAAIEAPVADAPVEEAVAAG